MKTTSLLFVALAAVFTLAPTSEAVCANMAVYTDCKNRGNAQLNACGFDDWTCKCAANTAIQNCYLQCPDDTDIQTEGRAYQPATQQSCLLAASQSSSKALATPAATPLVPAAAPATTPPPAVPAANQPPAGVPGAPGQSTSANLPTPSGKSAANYNKINVMFAAVPPVAAVIIGQFI
ncbi:hypothetical protein C1645_815797 [Glomus cerebriforme]|uniref:Extracellular membrane protein CFEM domain-containing protein n=1 Tax=Glomus cerebriforme TaxID=658196 RepID=A0A397TCZ7_9GLOM|nr:hypothetical protein C1645_815797 [Glomus cerebriforme]